MLPGLREHLGRQGLQAQLGLGAGIALQDPTDAEPVLELDRLDHLQQGHVPAGVLRAPAGVAQRVAHLLGLVDDDQEHAGGMRGGPGHGVTACGT